MRTSSTALRSTLLIVGIAGTVLGCATTGQYETVDRPPAGIFLETQQRAALPEGVILREVFERGLNLTKVSEGFVAKLYNDAAGYCTVGYGHLIKKAKCDGSEPAEFKPIVPEPRAAQILTEDMKDARIAVMLAVKVELTDAQFAALCDFVFNAGGGNFRKSTLLTVINRKEFDRVPAQFRRWTLAGGQTFAGLVTRREKEIELFFDGKPTPRAAPMEGEDLSPIDMNVGEVR